ncbi:hypothetical protein ASJ35_06770 [Ruthenibacterium lactatiformans]|uniref:Uncharacterized protein n=1 Tax=Ruthenibacterium lactatiformans TaxID=1550024 RepID=A0A0W7TSI1_9FIRM|nr:hypothetical protein [Ruthenibacterium lactatiformans]KUE76709.1 hypothetical protein ASJ35_06770 [Ruthenibacterium lactatiformans]
MLELAARFSETLYRGPLAHEVAQAGGAVKSQDKRTLPAHDRSISRCNVVAKEEKGALRFPPALTETSFQYCYSCAPLHMEI